MDIFVFVFPGWKNEAALSMKIINEVPNKQTGGIWRKEIKILPGLEHSRERKSDHLSKAIQETEEETRIKEKVLRHGQKIQDTDENS